jgi:hypothetical protein
MRRASLGARGRVGRSAFLSSAPGEILSVVLNDRNREGTHPACGSALKGVLPWRALRPGHRRDQAHRGAVSDREIRVDRAGSRARPGYTGPALRGVKHYILL